MRKNKIAINFVNMVISETFCVGKNKLGITIMLNIKSRMNRSLYCVGVTW